MPPRVSADHATFRDLKIFEERLKDTAASLQRRKSRYQLFLAHLLVLIALLLVEVFLPPHSSLFAAPCKHLLRWLYSPDSDVSLHPYVTSGLLFVSVTTLVLFFASGMYSEKIAYANKYVPHANRSLRSFNMYFNTRKPSLRSKFYWNPLSFFFPRPQDHHHNQHNQHQHQHRPSSSSSSSSSRSPSPSRSTIRDPTSSRPIPSIPPATNPRGELIFSSRIDKAFREGYERYRTAFEKKRQVSIRGQRKKLDSWEWLYKFKFWDNPTPTTTPPTTPTPSRVPSASSSSARGRRGSNSSAAGYRERSGSPMRQSAGRQSPIKRSGVESGGRRELADESDMRVQALERSLAAQGSFHA